jgi:LacI family transcriptional regulator
VPSVLLNRDVPGADVDRVMADNEGGAAQVAELLHGLGHRRIAFIAGPANTSTSRDREAGFSKALAQRGGAARPGLRRVGEFTHRSGYQWASDLLERSDRPSAVFWRTTSSRSGARRHAHLGSMSRARLSIVGFDDVPMASWGHVQPHHRASTADRHGPRRARMLIDRVEGREEREPSGSCSPRTSSSGSTTARLRTLRRP